MKWARLLVISIVCSTSLYALGQTAKSAFFYSKKPWSAARWYVIGQMTDRRIQWWGSTEQSGVSLNPACRFATSGFSYERGDEKQLEILQGGSFVLVEVDPLKTDHRIEMVGADDDDCRMVFKIQYALSDRGGPGIRPHLFLSPQSTVYRGVEFIVYAPLSSGRSDILLDLLIGAWRFTSNTAVPTANASLNLLPSAIARGEWKPSFVNKEFGLTLQLEQNLSLQGARKNQSLHISDIVGGAFLESYFPVSDGLQVRFSGKVYQHLADDGSGASTVSSATEFMFVPVLALSSNLYFGGRYFVGLGFDYGIPNEVVLGAVGQSLLAGETRFGLRLTDVTFWIVEGVYKNFKSETGASDKVLQFNTGVRLEL